MLKCLNQCKHYAEEINQTNEKANKDKCLIQENSVKSVETSVKKMLESM